MNRSSFGLSIFRIVATVCVLVLLGLIYWSTLLIEEGLHDVKRDVQELQGSMREHHMVTQVQSVQPHNHDDTLSSNLLQVDPFYLKTLPKLLGANFVPRDEIRSTEIGRPDHFHPFANWAVVGAARRLCVSTVATFVFGQYVDFAPDLAIRMEERKNEQGEPEFWVHLRNEIYWQPLSPKHFPAGFPLAAQFLQKHPVTAYDFKFHYDALMNPYVQEPGAAALRTYYRDIEEFRVIDEKTFVVKWRSKEFTLPSGEAIKRTKYTARQWTGGLTPLPTWLYQHFADGSKIIENDETNTYRTNSIWAQNFSQHWAKNVIASCGAWMFDKLTDRELRLKRNPNYHDPYAALTQQLVVEFHASPNAAFQGFKGLGSDYFSTRGATGKLLELEDFRLTNTYRKQAMQGAAIKKIDYIDRSFAYIGWNQNRPLFKSRVVRRALTMAIDRRRIISQILHGMGIEITGPFFPFDPAYDPLIDTFPYDPLQALRLLQQEGWEDHDGDGILDRVVDGKTIKFSFTLIYFYGASQTRAVCDYIATSLREIGIDCQPLGVDVADLSAAFEGKDFDALLLAWVLPGTASEPRQIWHSSGAREKGSSNAVGFSNPEADKLIEQLEYEPDQETRIGLYHRFHRLLHEEAPYTFLYAPKLSLLYRDYVKNVFIPANKPKLVPNATVTEPVSSVFYIGGRPG